MEAGPSISRRAKCRTPACPCGAGCPIPKRCGRAPGPGGRAKVEPVRRGWGKVVHHRCGVPPCRLARGPPRRRGAAPIPSNTTTWVRGSSGIHLHRAEQPDRAPMAADPKYRFGPLERRGLVAGWRGGQIAVLAAGLVVGVLALRSHPNPFGVVEALLALGSSLAVSDRK